MKFIQTLAIFLFSVSVGVAQEKSPVDKMLSAIENVKTITCEIKSAERLENRIAKVYQKLAATFNPLHCNIEFIEPRKGTEIIFVEGENDNEIYYNPNGFPYFDLNLDPFGNLARRNNHHTIKEVGFNYLANIIKHERKNNSNLFHSKEVFYKGKECFLIYARHEDYKTYAYKMKPKESIRDIAFRNRISEYLILSLNEELDSYNDWTDELIQIPNYFSYEIKIYIDSENWLPISIQIFDKKGIFEQYEYSNIIINQKVDTKKFKIN